jgi:hypothetical protein
LVNKPDILYIKTIATGLMETYPEISVDDLINYFLSKPGIREFYSYNLLRKAYYKNIMWLKPKISSS